VNFCADALQSLRRSKFNRDTSRGDPAPAGLTEQAVWGATRIRGRVGSNHYAQTGKLTYYIQSISDAMRTIIIPFRLAVGPIRRDEWPQWPGFSRLKQHCGRVFMSDERPAKELAAAGRCGPTATSVLRQGLPGVMAS
jgi:hypothetical protein